MITLHTSIPLKNEKDILRYLHAYAYSLFHSLKKKPRLLSNKEIDLSLIAADNAVSYSEFTSVLFENAANENTENYKPLMNIVNNAFLKIVQNSAYFKVFPAGTYHLNGEVRITKHEFIAPIGFYTAPFEDAKTNIYMVVKQVIDSWDPINLLDFAPDDEYDPEIKVIIDHLSDSDEENQPKTTEKTAHMIHQVFTEYFGSAYTNHHSCKDCFSVAKAICSELKR